MLPPPGAPRDPLPSPEDPSIREALNQIPSKPLPRGTRPKGGKLTNIQTSVPKSILLAFSQLETELGGRGKLVQTLLGADLPPRMQQFLGMVCDPDSDQTQLGHIAASAGVTITSLQRVFIEARKMRGIVLATDRIVERAPDVAAAVMDGATPGLRLCRRCMGAKEIEVPVTPECPTGRKSCPVCDGRGELWHEPDHDVQKTALKLSGLLTESKGVVVNQQTFVKGGGGDSGFDKLMTGLDSLLFGSGRDRVVQPTLDVDSIDTEGTPTDNSGEEPSSHDPSRSSE